MSKLINIALTITLILILAGMAIYKPEQPPQVRQLELKVYELQDRIAALERLRDCTVTIDVVAHDGYYGVAKVKRIGEEK